MRRILGVGLAVMLALTIGCSKKEITTPPGGGGGGGGGGTASIDGTYLLIGMEMLGKADPEAEIAKESEAERTFKFAGDKMTGMRGGKEHSATIKLDSSKTPHEIDIIDKKDDKTETSYGIYKLEGDKLTICAVDSDKPADRPKEFKTAPKDKAMIMILKKK